jgi:hypothetical protein
MSDISLHFAWYEWIAIAFMLGWPGLIVGAAAGVLLAPKHRSAAAALCGAAGLLIVFLVRLFY